MQNVIIKSNKSKTKVVSALKANSEAWHRDGSTIPLEGKIDDDGNFDLKLARNEKIYRQETAGLTFIGQISEESGTTAINITIKVLPALWVICILFLSLFIAMAAYSCFFLSEEGTELYLSIISYLFFGILFVTKYYHTYTKVKSTTLAMINILVS